MPTRQQNKVLVRNRFIEASQSLLASQSIQAISSRQIAVEAGISYQSLYNHYPTQGQIYADALREGAKPLSAQLDLVVKNYEADLLQAFGVIDTLRLDHLENSGMATWQFVANNMYANLDSGAHNQETEEASLIRILDPRIYERTHGLLQMAQGMGHLREQLDLQLIAYTLICLSDYALGRYLKFQKVSKRSVLQTSQEQYGLLLADLSSN